MNTADTPRNIAEVLTYLTEGGRRISDNALARAVDLPQPTITRIRNGTTAEPRSDAVEKLAAHFGLSAAQMRGEAPLPGFDTPRKARAEPAPYAPPRAPTEAELIATPHRSSAARREFARTHPCPATGRAALPCPGYVIDHITPLACGGPDQPANMQWQTADDAKAKDRWERRPCPLPH